MPPVSDSCLLPCVANYVLPAVGHTQRGVSPRPLPVTEDSLSNESLMSLSLTLGSFFGLMAGESEGWQDWDVAQQSLSYVTRRSTELKCVEVALKPGHVPDLC